jgi:hypothetical protein
MLLTPDDQVCGVPAAVAREAVRMVESVQCCSAGVLARELGVDLAAGRSLLEALEADGRLRRYLGMLPPGYDGAWLPAEEDETLVFWHLTYPAGKALAKARIGSPVPRHAAEGLLAEFLNRVHAVNNDPLGLHTIERVMLYGSLTDPCRPEVSDIDLLVYARSRGIRVSGQPCKPSVGGGADWRSEDGAAVLRMRLEALLRAGDERIDVCVVDEYFDDPHPLPEGAAEAEVFPA